MVNQRWPEFTINVICHDDTDLLRRTLPHNLRQLTEGTLHTYDVVLTVDGSESAPRDILLEIAEANGVDEVRLRRRTRNCAGGDPSNNGHIHAFSDKTRYLITLESDVAFFRIDPHFDPLDAFISFFQRHPGRPILHRMDDHDCWQWKLQRVAADVEPGVWSVNRVSSHFLVYDTVAARGFKAYPGLDVYHQSDSNWHNYEDELSQLFAEPGGPAIAFPIGWPIRVYHCDRKLSRGSAYYRKSPQIKLEIFEQRRAEVQMLVGQNASL